MLRNSPSRPASPSSPSSSSSSLSSPPSASAPRGREPLAGLRVAVTGGTSGLGLALVQALTAGGAQVAFVARGPERVARVARDHRAHGIVGDISSKEATYPIALQILGELGRLDVLINNASDLGAAPLKLLAD